MHNSAITICTILDAKYEKTYLENSRKDQCQHLTEEEHNYILKLPHKFEDLLDGTLGTCKISPVGFELK